MTVDDGLPDRHLRSQDISARQPIQALGLTRFIIRGMSNRDLWREVEPFLCSDKPIPEDYLVLHWCHEHWRCLKLDKNQFKPDSTYGALLQQFGVEEPQ